VSQVALAPSDTAAPGAEAPAPVVHVEKADGIKCERCWRFVPDVSVDPAVAGLCPRCVEALAPAVQR
jgi:isoleucyl-tRNA synthetase